MRISLWIGYCAALVSALSMAPQVIKVSRTKRTDDLSRGAFFALAAGLLLWLVYGIMIREAPVIAGNAVGLLLALYIIFMKVRHG